jgi:hypothetical protein
VKERPRGHGEDAWLGDGREGGERGSERLRGGGGGWGENTIKAWPAIGGQRPMGEGGEVQFLIRGWITVQRLLPHSWGLGGGGWGLCTQPHIYIYGEYL